MRSGGLTVSDRPATTQAKRWSCPATTRVKRSSVDARLDYDNVTPSVLSFEFSVELLRPDGTIVREATGAQLVDGLRSGSVQPTITLPDPLPPGVFWRFTVTDENGGVDQE